MAESVQQALAATATQQEQQQRERVLPVVYLHLYSVPFPRRISMEWLLELDRQQTAMRRMLAFVFDSVADKICSYVDAGPCSNLCFWTLRASRMPPCICRYAAAMLDQRWDTRFTVGELLRKKFWHVHLGKPVDRMGHERSWTMALKEIYDFLRFHPRMLQSSEGAQHKLRALFENTLCDQNACNRWK